MVYSQPLGRMVRSQFGQSVGLGDFCDCIYCPWLGQLCTCSHGDGEGKQDKKPKMHSIPIKGSVRAGPGVSLVSSGPVLSPPSLEGLQPQGWEHFKEDPEPLAGIPDTPILLFGVADKCSFLLKAKNMELREQQDEVPAEPDLLKVQETLPGAAWLCCI